jgi:hypothetical protein
VKKLLLSLGLLAGVASAAQAQESRVGIKAGVGLSTVAGNDAQLYKNRFGFQAGIMADIGLTSLLAFHPELLYSQKGGKIEGSGSGSYPTGGGTYVSSQSGKLRLGYLDLPLLLRLKAAGAFFEVGPQVGLLLSRDLNNTSVNEVTYAGGTGSSVTTDNVSVNNTNGARKLDVGYVLGVGYHLSQGLELGLRYNGGLSKLAEGDSAPKMHNSVFQFQVGYLFGGQ